MLDILFGRQGILCERNDISFVGIQNVICRIINTAKYSVDSGVLDLILSVIFLVRNKLVRPAGSIKNKEDGTKKCEFRESNQRRREVNIGDAD